MGSIYEKSLIRDAQPTELLVHPNGRKGVTFTLEKSLNFISFKGMLGNFVEASNSKIALKALDPTLPSECL